MTNDELDKLKELAERATPVVKWYSHGLEDGTVRGPFCRWFKCTEVEPQYQKNVSTVEDDCNYAAAAMNAIPKLIAEVKRLEDQLAEAREVIEHYSDAECVREFDRSDLGETAREYLEKYPK